jgi:hypothetical protein
MHLSCTLPSVPSLHLFPVMSILTYDDRPLTLCSATPQAT